MQICPPNSSDDLCLFFCLFLLLLCVHSLYNSLGIVIPTLVLCVLTIWYLLTLTRMLRESNDDLKDQLHRERTEERRKLTAAKNDDQQHMADAGPTDR